MKGTPPNERRPGYFNGVHGIAVNPKTRRVYVNDRNNGRVQASQGPIRSFSSASPGRASGSSSFWSSEG